MSLLAEYMKRKKTNRFIIETVGIENSEFYLVSNKKKFELKKTNILVDKDNIKISSTIDGNKKIIISIKDLKILNNKINEIKYKVKMSGNFNYEFDDFSMLNDLKIKGTNLLIKMNGTYRDGGFSESKVLFTTKGESLIDFNNNLLKDVNLKLAYSGDLKKKFNFEIIEFSSKSKNNNIYEFNNISASYEKNKNINIYAKNLNFNSKKLFQDYDLNIKSNCLA